MKSVVIVQRRMTHYRVRLFELMKTQLAERQIHLRLMVGQPTLEEKLRNDSADIGWAEKLGSSYWLKDSVCWQPLRNIDEADLVVVPHENKLIYNHWLLLRSRSYRLAFWGHGRNMQSESPSGPREKFKRWTAGKADWWFAYTELTRRALNSYGYTSDRITVLNNAIDTEYARYHNSAALSDSRESTVRDLGLAGKSYALCIGSLYRDKRLDFALEAVKRARLSVPDLEFVVVGDGPEREQVVRWAAEYPWIHWLGARRGIEKAELIKNALILLNPGAVGLVVLEAFFYGKVLLTVVNAKHGPEVAYLQDGVNSVICADSVEEYADAIRQLAWDGRTRNRLGEAGRLASLDLTVERMSDRFCRGIEECLASPLRKS